MSTPSVLSVHLSKTHTFSKTTQKRGITLLTGLGVKGDCHLGITTQHLWRKNSTKPEWRNEPNLRQVHLIQSELFDEPDFHGDDGRRVEPGQLGENVTTKGVDLLKLGRGTRLRFVGEGGSKCDGFVKVLDVLVRATFIAVVIAGLVTRTLGSLAVGAVVVHLTTILLRLWLDYQTQRVTGVAVVKITGIRQPCMKINTFRAGLKAKCLIKEDGKPVVRKAGIMGIVEVGGMIRPGMRIEVENAEAWEELPVLP